MIGAKSSDIIFTSGGTEGNNWILQTAIKHYRLCFQDEKSINDGIHKLPHIITSNLEHDSIKCVLQHFIKEGLAAVTFVKARHTSGRIEVDDILSAIQPTTCLITIMLANNETGIIQPIQEISEKLYAVKRSVNESRILLHTDAAQAIGKIPVNVDNLGVDYLTIVGHKFYGPRIGAIYVNDVQQVKTPLYAMLHGGGQEYNLRSGTENTGMIAGLGKVVFGKDVCINGKFTTSERLPNTCNVSFLNTELKGHEILKRCKQVQASVGAACHSQNRASHILQAIGVSDKIAWSALRLSVGRETSEEDIDRVIKDIKQALPV
ncbi:selenocysteine lyase [Patella vulgata]|uniref:selenocysteine lyase n=1 Tax=Patella vulgata TaxID=6465 RepID=UPI00217F719E|nr:selenocysteine lyase [Patella vulgata]